MESEFICGLGEIPENSEMAELVRESENCIGFIINQSYAGQMGRVMELNNSSEIHMPYPATHDTDIISKTKKQIRIDTDERPFKCDQCDYSSTTKCSLTVDKRKHSGEKPFKCDHCDYAAANSSHLKVHKRTHSGEKPFKCDQCDYASYQKQRLKEHLLTKKHMKRTHETHSVEKPFKCTECDYSSTRLGGLQVHQRSHTYKCD